MLPEKFKKSREDVIQRIENEILPYGGRCGKEKDIQEMHPMGCHPGHYFPIYWENSLPRKEYFHIIPTIEGIARTFDTVFLSAQEWWVRIPEFWC